MPIRCGGRCWGVAGFFVAYVEDGGAFGELHAAVYEVGDYDSAGDFGGEDGEGKDVFLAFY